MPIYEYRCRQCGKAFELLVRTGSGQDEEGPRCPACDSNDLKRLFSLFASPSERPAMAMSGGGGCCGGGCGCH